MLRNVSSEGFEAGLESAYAVIVPSPKEAMAKRILEKLGPAPGAGRLPRTIRLRPRSGKRVPITKLVETRIREIIEEWPNPDLDWGAVVAAANAEFRAGWKRQSLANHTKIQNAFQDKKDELRKAREVAAGVAPKPNDSVVEYLNRTIRALTNENTQLKAKLAECEARMARWRHNAYLHRMTIDQLDEPLQENDRGRSDR